MIYTVKAPSLRIPQNRQYKKRKKNKQTKLRYLYGVSIRVEIIITHAKKKREFEKSELYTTPKQMFTLLRFSLDVNHNCKKKKKRYFCTVFFLSAKNKFDRLTLCGHFSANFLIFETCRLTRFQCDRETNSIIFVRQYFRYANRLRQ